MNSWKTIAIVKIVLILMMTIVVSGTPRYSLIKSPQIVKQPKLAVCLPFEKPCIMSKDPCCSLVYKQTYLGLGSVETTCFKFGKGVCQVNHSIENLDEYNRLIQLVNETNFQELKTKYWKTIPVAYTCPEKVTIELKQV